MTRSYQWLDSIAETDLSDRRITWLERTAFAFLILTAVSAPHSIAATQTAWLIGMAAWLVRLFLKPRPSLRTGALDIALWGFFVWSAVTSVFSYDPATSIDKLRGTALFLLFYFAYHTLKNIRAVWLIAFVLIGSCMINVLWTPIQRLIGRGVEIHGVAPDGPLGKALLKDGDTLLAVNGRKVRTPEEVLEAMEAGEVSKIRFYRPDFEFTVEAKRLDLLATGTPIDRLGFQSWKKSRNWRSSGFYGHYTTYAEVLQLIASLVFGLFVAAILRPGPWGRMPAAILAICLAAMMLALLMTVTRASQLAFLISAFVMVLIGAPRKWMLLLLVVMVPVGIAGLIFLQQSRDVGFFDSSDESIRWRQTVWREGYGLWTESPRNFVLGVGMDSIKKYAAEWHLFDDGRLPMGHFHSTPLNLLVERGLPALILWLTVLAIYARSLWLGIRSAPADWQSLGILLGCLGGLAGFFVSGLVHYNLGDQEVAMVFFLLMALGVRISGSTFNDSLDTSRTHSRS